MPIIYRTVKYGKEADIFNPDRKQKSILISMNVPEHEMQCFIHNEVAERKSTDRMKAECEMKKFTDKIVWPDLVVAEKRWAVKQNKKKKKKELFVALKVGMDRVFYNPKTDEIVHKKKNRRKRRKKKKKKGMPKPPTNISVCE